MLHGTLIVINLQEAAGVVVLEADEGEEGEIEDEGDGVGGVGAAPSEKVREAMINSMHLPGSARFRHK